MEFLRDIQCVRNHNRKIGFTASSFDLLHAGHVAMLMDCRNNCDFLIVALQTNPTIDRPHKHVPVESVFERWSKMQIYADMVIPFDHEQDLLDILLIVNPDIRFVGQDYEGVDFTGKYLDIPIHYNPRPHNYSSTQLRERVTNANVQLSVQDM